MKQGYNYVGVQSAEMQEEAGIQKASLFVDIW